MKNRYGMDGLTYNAKVDTTTGHIDLDENNEGVELKESKPLSAKSSDEWNNNDLMKIRSKFAELEDLI
jgi:hypothetical protein